MNILIVYATTEGQTRKIAEFLKAEGERTKHTAILCDATNNPVNPSEYDAVLIGASVHEEKYPASIEDYINKYKQPLNLIHSGFVSVSLTAASDDEQLWDELRKATTNFLQDTGWKPKMVEYTAGALLYTKYDFFKKFIVRQIAKKASGGNERSQDVEFTDWKKLQLFFKTFIDTWTPLPVTVEPDVSDREAIS